MTLQGKGFFLFNIPDCDGGNLLSILNSAKTARLSHILVKIADGAFPFGVEGANDFTASLVSILRSSGIAVWGWHYVYGNDPVGEAAIAISRSQALHLDGYVVDAEEEYKKPGKDAAARQFMSTVRKGLDIPIALSSYRFPNYHQEFPWADFLEKCDYIMPQMYWEQAHNAGWQLRESKRQCDALPNAKPFIPTGSTYGTPPVWEPNAAEVTDFLTTARTLGLPAVNFFDWDYCRAKLPQVWDTIAKFPLSETTQIPTPVPQPDMAGDYLAALNGRQAEKISLLYKPTAVFVKGEMILTTQSAIKQSYTEFFSGIPAEAVFAKVLVESHDDLWQISWKAGRLKGESTLVVQNRKIVLDYTFIE